MDIKTLGFLTIVVLAILLMVGWFFNQDGILTATIIGIIGAICGSIFGYAYKLKKN
jgi:hypothetical protein